ncbi:MAG: beta-ketoacyl-ACP synthase III [Opitutaceae bacterium]|jgi:3-oxoacyl-[acyl-carrier-protein] synthase-3
MASPLTAVVGTGSYAPAKILTNADLTKIVDTSEEWIVNRTGIRERRIAAANETNSDMAAHAGSAALADAGLPPAAIDVVIVATMTPDMPMPSTACFVQHKLNIPTHAACFDVNAACSGFLYALETGCALVESGRYRHALVIGSEKVSTILDWTDRTTCVLFGDAAGAIVIGRATKPGAGFLGCNLNAKGSVTDILYIPGGGSNLPATPDSVAHRQHFVKMKGREVFKIAVRSMEESAREILEQHHLSPDQISCVIPHQANLRIIELIAENLRIPLDRFFINLDRYGNTSAASIPLALDEARRAGRVRTGDTVLMVAFGAGLTYGSALIRL